MKIQFNKVNISLPILRNGDDDYLTKYNTRLSRVKVIHNSYEILRLKHVSTIRAHIIQFNRSLRMQGCY